MEKLGGGGHHTMAAAQLKDISFDDAMARLNEAIQDTTKRNSRIKKEE